MLADTHTHTLHQHHSTQPSVDGLTMSTIVAHYVANILTNIVTYFVADNMYPNVTRNVYGNLYRTAIFAPSLA